MNPFVIIAVVGSLVGVGGVAFGVDQQDKRIAEQEHFRRKIRRLEKLVAIREQEYDTLVFRLGRKNSQVRKLYGKIKRLRAELAEARRAA